MDEKRSGRYVLIRTKSRWICKGYQAYKEIYYYEDSTKPVYYHGQHPFSSYDPREDILIPFDDLNLEWNNLYQPYVPTFWDKLKSKLFKKPYPEEIKVIPKDDSLVIVDYGFDLDFCEVAKFSQYPDGSCCWTTELFTGLKPKRWAYIPNIDIDD